MAHLPQNRLRYILHSPSAGDREVFPTGESTFKVRFDLSNEEDDPIFDYIVSFEGDLIFAGDDYHWLKDIEESAERCETLIVEIKDKGCSEEPEILPGTTIKLSDGEYDMDRCRATFKISSPDKYQCYNEKKDDKLNIFDAAGSGIDALFYDPTITIAFFDYSYVSPPFAFGSQAFEHFPNKNSEYPGFGIDNEEFFVNATTPAILYVDPATNLGDLEPHITTGGYNLTDGDVPKFDPAYFSGGSAALAAAQGWRLYYARYAIDTDTPGTNLNFQYKFGWCRLEKFVPTGTPVPGWIYVDTTLGVDRYARVPVMGVKSRDIYYSQLPAASTFLTDEFAFTSEMINYIVGYDKTTDVTVHVERERNGYPVLKNGISLNDIISQAVFHCCPDLTVKSDFFQINPWTVSADNPITGDDSTTNEIVVYQKSDVKRPFDSNVATVGSYTPAELMLWLWQLFQVKFRIVGTDFMIEHISSPLFNHSVVIDLTTPGFNKMISGTRVYTYVKPFPSKETFLFADSRPDININDPFGPQSDFIGAHILYDGNCVDRSKTGVKNNALSRVSTDVEYITQYGDKKDNTISDDGFVFVSTAIISGDRYIITKPFILNTVEQINNVMGWAYLHDMFFRTDRNSISGTMNNASTTFDSTKYIKKSRRLVFDLCCIDDFDIYAFINWALGEGIYNNAIYSITNRTMDVEIGFRD